MAGVAASASHGGRSAPAAFQLVFDGKHNSDLLHEGPFTTSASFCPSGYAVDVSIDDVTSTATRRFTCDDPSGGFGFVALVSPLPAEHGGGGSWQIVQGSGPLADLRGKGTWTSVRLGGSDPPSITFRSTWDGFVDFDVSPPAVAVTGTGARKLRRPAGAYRLRLAASLTDAGGLVSYRLVVVDPRNPLVPLASKTGDTSGSLDVVLRVRPKKTARILRLEIDAADVVGNRLSVVRAVRLPRS